MKIIERAGPKIADLLSTKHPCAKETCDKPHCLPCKSKPGSCRASSICYRIKCETGSQKGIKESHRSWYERSQEHNNAIRTRNSNYAIVKHWEETTKDQEDPPKFSYHLISRHRSALERQIWESLYIENEECDILLNGKGEWGLNIVPRLKTDKENDPKEPPANEEAKSTKGKRKIQPDNAKTDAELALFSGQYTQRKKSKRETKKQSERVDGVESVKECAESLAEGDPRSKF